MNAGELDSHFRTEVFDTVEPFLWSPEESRRYALDAYRMFVRLTGGVADFSSPATQVYALTGENSAELHPSILRIMSAYRVADGADVTILNQTDLVAGAGTDYGQLIKNINSPVTGRLDEMIIGRQKDTAYFAALPAADETIQLAIYRLPLIDVLEPETEFSDIGEEHVLHLVDWMKHLAFRKDDVEVHNLSKSDAFGADFRAYCTFAKAELERKKHKPRVVAYGGL